MRRFAGHGAYVGPLSHLRIAHLTDLHCGFVTPYEVQEDAVALTNAEKPDLVVITGDFVCHSQLYLDQLKAVIEAFEAPVLTVLGNHDHWSGAEEVRNAIRKGGGEVLDNQHTTLELRHQRLQVVGLDDAYTGHADREKAVKGLRADLPVLGLSHIAEEADALWRAGVPLVLSGHTHAGQITVASIHEFSIGRLAGHKYVHGMYGKRGKDVEATGAVYVGAGVGAAVFPLRLGERAKREVTMFELGVVPGSIEEPLPESAAMPGRKPTEREKLDRAMKVARRQLARSKITLPDDK